MFAIDGFVNPGGLVYNRCAVQIRCQLLQTIAVHSMNSGKSVIIIDAGLEHALVHAAYRAAPVIGKILEFGSGSNAVLRITFGGVICVSTGIAKIFLHNCMSPFCFSKLYL